LPNPPITSQADHKFSDFFTMLENELSNRPKRHPIFSLFLLLLVVFLGFVIVGPLIGFVFSIPFYPGTFMEFVSSLEKPMEDPDLKIPLYIMQGFATFVGLILGPAWFLQAEKRSLAQFFRNQIDWIPVLVTVFIVIIFMAVNSVFIEWNSAVHFPDFAKGFETWARDREDAAAELTSFLTRFDSVFEVTLAIVVIALIPAFGEEIVFRGIIQDQLFKSTKNIHLSIWLAAMLFSAIHVQFFGFVPRLLLGALFGYLYYWSGNLWFPIVAHFVNNGFSVLAMYFYQQGKLEFDLEKTESVPANVVMISGVLTAGLLFYFYKYFENRKPRTDYL
jgi:membrane protease YdiL (CAAX protease family)